MLLRKEVYITQSLKFSLTILVCLQRFSLFTFCGLAALSSYIYSHEENKAYIELEQVLFDSTGIYVESLNGLVPVSSINHDTNGFWYEPRDEWTCPNCGADNGGGEYGGQICSNCKWPIKDRTDLKKR